MGSTGLGRPQIICYNEPHAYQTKLQRAASSLLGICVGPRTENQFLCYAMFLRDGHYPSTEETS